MSKEQGIYKKGKAYQVRWREGGRNRSKNFDRLTDAKAWRDDMRRRKQMGGMDTVSLSDDTLLEFTRTWLRIKVPELSANTVRGYDFLLNHHVLPYLGGYKLSEMRPGLISDWQDQRLAAGAGRRSIAQAQALLSTICRAAVAREMMRSNPCDPIAAPRRRKKSVIPLSPPEVEALRQHMLSEGKVGEATLISVLAYAGLRPQEAVALRWEDISESHIRVVQKVVEGEIVHYTKNEVPRNVEIRGPLAGDLKEWWLLRDEPAPTELVFPRSDGKPMTRTDIGNFRRRTFIPAREAVGLPSATPYALRHSFASMLIVDGSLTLPQIALECGHDLQTLVKHYAHIVQGATNNVPFAEQIRQAREVSEHKTTGQKVEV